MPFIWIMQYDRWIETSYRLFLLLWWINKIGITTDTNCSRHVCNVWLYFPMETMNLNIWPHDINQWQSFKNIGRTRWQLHFWWTLENNNLKQNTLYLITCITKSAPEHMMFSQLTRIPPWILKKSLTYWRMIEHIFLQIDCLYKIDPILTLGPVSI